MQKVSDDGEPGGTVGVPMLRMLLRRDMCCVAEIVTRYYGGVELGAGASFRCVDRFRGDLAATSWRSVGSLADGW